MQVNGIGALGWRVHDRGKAGALAAGSCCCNTLALPAVVHIACELALLVEWGESRDDSAQ